MVTRFVTMIAIGLMAAGSAAFAQENGNTTSNDDTKPPAMMGKHGGGKMGGMDTAQMHRMMENCNRMMDSRMQPKAPVPDKKG